MCTIMCYCSEKADYQQFVEGLSQTDTRGPDAAKILHIGSGLMGFQRLSIMGLTAEGMQPFSLHGNYLICNGEIYGFRPLREKLIQKGYSFSSDSDCEILLPLYEEFGLKMFSLLDAEFALVFYDAAEDSFIAARDPIGIRPLFYGYDQNGKILFASEAKNLVHLVQRIYPFPPGHYYKDGNFICYRDITEVTAVHNDSLDILCQNIHDKLIAGVKKRLDSDVPMGFLLSGGLDSSLICAISASILKQPIRTFAIGMETDAIDLKYAREVAEYIGSEHTEILITREQVIQALPDVIKTLATYDITTIRASVGMYLLCQEIHRTTDIRVLLTGEISDELFGYKYTDFAPSPEEFQQESIKRVKELYMYDVLRADRCISVHSMEARVPFGDLDFASYVLSIAPEKKMNVYNKGKYLLRRAFEPDTLLPQSILMREKAAFSDAVGHSLVDDLKEYAETVYTDEVFMEKARKHNYAAPFTKESLLYRELFESFYPEQAHMIKDFWMPNKKWKGCNVSDPSARVLSNYGASGY